MSRTIIMSLSTTSTTAYTLAKYSRFFPSSSGSQENGEEWQHFTNPTIRLILDMRKSAGGDLESYRCRVIWSLNSGVDGIDSDQHEVAFVSVLLYCFSASASMTWVSRRIWSCFRSPRPRSFRTISTYLRFTDFHSKRSTVVLLLASAICILT